MTALPAPGSLVLVAPGFTYRPSVRYLGFAIAALAGSILCAWFATRFPPSAGPALLFFASSAALFWLATRPSIRVLEEGLFLGNRTLMWTEVRAVDHAGWLAPLIVNLTLQSGERIHLVYPGDLASAERLLSQLRLLAREALIDGRLWAQFWGEHPDASEDLRPSAAREYGLLAPGEEDEVERLLQRLKSVGHLDSRDHEN